MFNGFNIVQIKDNGFHYLKTIFSPIYTSYWLNYDFTIGSYLWRISS